MANSRGAKLKKRLIEYHWHGPSVHFHSALFPIAAILLLLYLSTGEGSLEKASFYVLGFAVLLLIGSILAGFFDWRTKYNSARTKVFQGKIRLSLLLLPLGLALVTWRAASPQLLQGGGVSQGLYTAGVVLSLAMVVRIGYLGGKLIFRRQR